MKATCINYERQHVLHTWVGHYHEQQRLTTPTYGQVGHNT